MSCGARYVRAYDRSVSTPRRTGAIVVTAGACVALIGTFLTWVRSGATGRSSYEVFDLVDRLGFSPDGIVGWALRLWPLVPVLLALSVVATWWTTSAAGTAAPAAVLVVVTGVYAGGTAAAVIAAPEAGQLLGIGAGPAVTVAGASAMLCGVGVGQVWRRPTTDAR
jgi:hypothetical protein